MAKSAEEIIEHIAELVKGLWAHSEDPQNLSKDLNEIAVLHWALGMWRTTFDEQEREAKAELDLDKANSMLEYVDAGEAVNKAEIRTTIKLGGKRKAYNKMASDLDKVKTMMGVTQSAMDAARSRLSLIKENINSGGGQ